MSSFYTQMFPPKPQWNFDDIPDLTGKVMIVTGGNTGIGKETIKQLLLRNAKVYMASRSPPKALEAIEELKNETGKEAIFLKLDLDNLKAVRGAAEEYIIKETQLHVLFNSGGVMVPPVKDLTSDGYDLQFGTNVLGHFYFTKLLLPVLASTAQASPDGKSRVVNTSSVGHTLTSTIDFETVTNTPKRKKQLPAHLYAQSKFGNVVFSNELHRRYADQGIVSISLHPGNLKTDLQRHSGIIMKALLNPILYPAPMGAITQLWAGTSLEGATYGGGYLIPWARIGEARKETNDLRLGQQLWEWLEVQVVNV